MQSSRRAHASSQELQRSSQQCNTGKQPASMGKSPSGISKPVKRVSGGLTSKGKNDSEPLLDSRDEGDFRAMNGKCLGRFAARIIEIGRWPAICGSAARGGSARGGGGGRGLAARSSGI